MRCILTLLLLLPLSSFAALPEVALPEYTADYDFERGRMKIGETAIRLERSQDNIYRYSSESEATGFVSIFVDDIIREESIFRFENGEFWPVSYEYRQLNSSKNRNEDIAYDWTDRTARINYRGHKSEQELVPGMLDRFLLQLAITVHGQDGEIDRVYEVLDNNRLKQFHLQGNRQESVTTPAGTFETLRVERIDNDPDKRMRLWLAPELDYLPVKIEHEKRNEEPLRLTLRSINRRVPESPPPADVQQ